MAGGNNNSSGKRASPSPSSSEKQQQAKRTRGAPAGGEHAKETCSSQTQGAAMPLPGLAVVPPQSAASNAVAMPMVGINGAVAPQRSAAASASALPMVAGDGSAPSMLTTPVPVQVITVPMQMVYFVPMAGAVSGSPSPTPWSAPAVSLAVTLFRFQNSTLERMMTELMRECTPPLRAQDRKSGGPPSWWPTAAEPWWFSEVVVHLRGRQMDTPVPFATPRRLKRAEKVAVLVAAVKHITPDFGRISAAANRSRLTELEASLWGSALRVEHQRHVMSVLIQMPPPPQQPQPQQQQQQQLPVNGRVLMPSHSSESSLYTVSDSESDEPYIDDSVFGEVAAHDSASKQIVPTAPEKHQQQHGNEDGVLLPLTRCTERAAHADSVCENVEKPVEFSVSGEVAALDGGIEQIVTTETEPQLLPCNGNVLPPTHSAERAAHADSESAGDEQPVVDFSVSGEVAALDGGSEQIVTTETEPQLLPCNGNVLPPTHSAERAAHADSESAGDEQPVVDFSVSRTGNVKDASLDGGSEQIITTEPELEPLAGDGNGPPGATAPEEEGQQQQQPEDTTVPQLQQHEGEGHGHHNHDDIFGDLAGSPAPEHVDWFDSDEVRRMMLDLEIPTFFGGFFL
ncbi:hypothetical protein GUJ93_ZPchr0007g3699 [Zizania palustris]|uniref:Ethylene insensitive 3-like DNA-binding domain-containing protein n=1 Tax=Zizania palustris TaxID=103762 RepID=A0A8J5TA75_ZIZPA|nr:hypothetical protein GUJ93_ZPchr0007g3197 [Zizania palustris]KAG8081148.1 hypothetical protein GUJ93_ZPchr0007g3699 [Zizania palustris]